MYPANQMKKGIFLIASAALCWSLGGVLVKLIPWNAFAICGIRSLIALLFTCAVSRSFRIRLTLPNILGGVCLSATAFFFILANKYTTAANAIVLQYTAPVYIVLLTALVHRKPVSRIDAIGVVIILGGIVLFFLDDLSGGHLMGNIFSLCSGVFFALMFFSHSMKGATPMEATRLGHLLAAIIGVPFALMPGGATVELVPWLSILAMGAVQLGLGYFLFAKGSPLVPPLTASLISCVEPIANPIWVMLAVHEKPGFWALIGIAVVMTGIVVYNVMSSRAAQAQETETTQ